MISFTEPLPYSPWDQLPCAEPRAERPPPGYFYEHTAKHLIKDAVRIMDNGLAINLEKVIELEATLEDVLAEVASELRGNPLIQKYLEERYEAQVKAYIEERKSKLRSPADYIVEFQFKNMTHRSYFMDEYATTQGWQSPEEKLPTGVGKWPVRLVKKYAAGNRVLQRLLAGDAVDVPAISKAMIKLAEDKAALYNEKYLDQIELPDVPYPVFNPGSAKQKQELFDLLQVPAENFSKKTNLPSWDRVQIERVNAETTDEDIRHFTQCFIDYSFAAIIRNNFIEAFYNFTVDGRLYGQYKLLGAKSGRFTSSSPNMLNLPSTGSRFAKPVKQCLQAPKGKVIAAIDYSALEDRVFANLTKDTNKIAVFTQGVDGHSLAATYYFPDRVKATIGEFTVNIDAAMQLKDLVDKKMPEAVEVRQDSKPISFGLAYGAYPPKVARTIKCELSVAEGIFTAYHTEMYPGITEYREQYVLPTANAEGEIHLGMGFYLKSDFPDNDIRTLHNATAQFWSILTILTINKMHHLIDAAGYQEDILITSTIYDSIYAEITCDAEIIKWYNDHIVPVMEQDFVKDQIVENEARVEIGPSWAELTELTKDAPLEEIQEVLKEYALA